MWTTQKPFPLALLGTIILLGTTPLLLTGCAGDDEATVTYSITVDDSAGECAQVQSIPTSVSGAQGTCSGSRFNLGQVSFDFHGDGSGAWLENSDCPAEFETGTVACSADASFEYLIDCNSSLCRFRVTVGQ